jgi:hypothetical protein
VGNNRHNRYNGDVIEDDLTDQVARYMKSYQWELHTGIDPPFQIQSKGWNSKAMY